MARAGGSLSGDERGDVEARTEAGEPEAGTSLDRALWLLVALFAISRIAYHSAFFALDPFAYVTISDGQIYEASARDILAHPPLGSLPLYLQGLYAYLLAAGIALWGAPAGGLYLQLGVSACAIALFGLAARACFGARAGTLSLLALLASPSIAFYENKYLSVSLGVSTCMALLFAGVVALARPHLPAALGLGVAGGLALLGRGNLLLAFPFCAGALWLAADQAPARAKGRLLLAFACGALLSLGPLALRNAAVTGEATVFPSHGGGTPFFIGNNPHANGRWNDAGGLLSGQVFMEQRELGQRLGLSASASDADIGRELYRRAFAYMREQPGDYAALQLKKLWYLTGNHAFVRDYDLLGERELLGGLSAWGLPFGVMLGLGALGAHWLWREARRGADRAQQRRRAALALLLLGLAFSVVAANLLWFTSAQNRAPLLVPLCFLAGPGLCALPGLWGERKQRWAFALAVLALTLQSFVPRASTAQPSSVHYFNLASAEEELGRDAEALGHYATASERNPKQPMFWLRRAHLARRMGRADEAHYALARLLSLPGLDPALRDAALAERRALSPARAPN